MESLKKARENAGFQVRRDAAQRLGLHLDQLRKYENGQHKPSITVLKDMADLYGVTLDELVGRNPHAGIAV